MMENGVGREDAGEKSVVAADGESDLLGGRGVCGVGDYEFRGVRALAADEGAGDGAGARIERHAFGQWGKIGVGAGGENVGRSAASAGDGAAGVGGALRAGRTGGGGDGQRAAGAAGIYGDLSGGSGGAGSVRGGESVGGGRGGADTG